MHKTEIPQRHVWSSSSEKVLRTCATRADSDHPAHMQSIIRTFSLHSYILWYLMLLLEDSESPDQTARMRSLIWAFAVHIWSKTRFRIARPV